MDSIDAARKFCEHAGIPLNSSLREQVENNLRPEITEMEDYLKKRRDSGRGIYERAVERALSNAITWYDSAEDVQLDLSNITSLREFVGHSRHSYVYFTLLGKELKHKHVK